MLSLSINRAQVQTSKSAFSVDTSELIARDFLTKQDLEYLNFMLETASANRFNMNQIRRTVSRPGAQLGTLATISLPR